MYESAVTALDIRLTQSVISGHEKQKGLRPVIKYLKGAWGDVVVKALRSYSDGPEIEKKKNSRDVTGFFCDISSDRTMAVGSTQPLVKMSTPNISWG